MITMNFKRRGWMPFTPTQGMRFEAARRRAERTDPHHGALVAALAAAVLRGLERTHRRVSK